MSDRWGMVLTRFETNHPTKRRNVITLLEVNNPAAASGKH